MKQSRLMVLISILLFLAVWTSHSQTYLSAPDAVSALNTTQQSKKYFFALVTDKSSDELVTMEKSIKSFQEEQRGKFNLFKINLNNAKETDFINTYQLSRAPTPLLLIFSPEGVVTGGYPKAVNSEQLKQSISWPELTLKIMKSLQDKKITLVSLQNKKTKFNTESDKALNEFLAVPGYQLSINIIKADPALDGSADFLKQVNITNPITEATIVFLMPPGRIVKIHSGKITKADLEASMQSHAPDGSCCPAPAKK